MKGRGWGKARAAVQKNAKERRIAPASTLGHWQQETAKKTKQKQKKSKEEPEMLGDLEYGGSVIDFAVDGTTESISCLSPSPSKDDSAKRCVYPCGRQGFSL